MKYFFAVLFVAILGTFFAAVIDSLNTPVVNFSCSSGKAISIEYPDGTVKMVNSDKELPAKYEKVWTS